jgi:acyl phosphate:glycerol-3-phosphate acyltransferase
MSYLLAGTLVLASYLIGSVPPAFLVGKWMGGIDIRRHGSGNVGATNVLRTLGVGPSIAVLALDFLKGFIPAWVGWQVSGSLLVASLCALAAVCGHNWSVFLHFTGGKGVTTSVGGIFVLSPLVGTVALATGLVLIAITRYVSLGSVVGAALVPIGGVVVVLLGGPPEILIYCLVAGPMTIYRHRGNIKRLLSGTERKLGQRAGTGQ